MGGALVEKEKRSAIKDRSEIEKLAKMLKSVIEERQLRYVELFSKLLTYQTTSGASEPHEARLFEKELDRCLEYIGERLDDLGFVYRRYDNMVAVGELYGPSNTKAVGIATHLDVVPPGEDWTVPPFGGLVRDGSIWGRGAQDDKGPAASILAALDALRSLERRSKGALRRSKNIRLLFGTREETETWPDIDLLKGEEEDPEFVVVPDGAYPVINAEKGIVTLELDLHWSQSTDEGSDRCDVVIRSGTRPNAVPDRATVELDARSPEVLEKNLDAAKGKIAQLTADAEFQIEPVQAVEGGRRYMRRVEFWGEAAHAAYPEKGHNAALDALAFTSLLATAPRPVVRFSRALWESCRALDGSALGLAKDDPYYGPTTVSLGTLEMLPGKAKAAVNVRFPRGIDADDIEEKFEHRLAKVGLSAFGADLAVRFQGQVQPPIYVDPKEHRELLGPLNLAYESVTGREGGYGCLAGTTYAKAFPLAVAFGPLDFSAGDEEMAHAADERVTIFRYLENVAVYATAICLLAYDWRGLSDL